MASNAILPEQVTVYIGAADAAIAACESFTAEITNFSESGGEEDIESVPVFGGGNIDKTKPRTQIEVSFDAILQYNAAASTVLKWDILKYGAEVSGVVTSAGSADTKVIYMEFTDGTLYYTRAYNNAKGVSFEPETAADDMMKGTMTMKLSPTEPDGSDNLQVANLAANTLSWA